MTKRISQTIAHSALRFEKEDHKFMITVNGVEIRDVEQKSESWSNIKH